MVAKLTANHSARRQNFKEARCTEADQIIVARCSTDHGNRFGMVSPARQKSFDMGA